MTDHAFPPEAYSPTGELWWDLAQRPGSKRSYGAEPKIAAWLYFNKSVGDRFTLRELREVLGTDSDRNDQEHFNRRMRELRKLGWSLPSSQEQADLRPDEYRVAVKGWHPGAGPRPKTSGVITPRTRRQVLERDGHRCVICGVANGEPYPDPPHANAVMSIGHRIPRELDGTDDIDNLQVECKRCNEPVRDEVGLPETLDEVYAEVRGLKRAEKSVLLKWLRSGRRLRSKVDSLYDRARRLNPGERATMISRLEAATEMSKSQIESADD